MDLLWFESGVNFQALLMYAEIFILPIFYVKSHELLDRIVHSCLYYIFIWQNILVHLIFGIEKNLQSLEIWSVKDCIIDWDLDELSFENWFHTWTKVLEGITAEITLYTWFIGIQLPSIFPLQFLFFFSWQTLLPSPHYLASL